MKKRINVTIDRDMEKSINLLAKHKRLPKAAIATALIREALELQEDFLWVELAEHRRKTHKGRYLTHEEVWGK